MFQFDANSLFVCQFESGFNQVQFRVDGECFHLEEKNETVFISFQEGLVLQTFFSLDRKHLKIK